MRTHLTIACVFVAALLGSHAPAAGQQPNPFRLKDPDQKKICLACHSDFDQKLKKKSVHTPVRTGECSGCHEPHVSTHGKLLAASTREICSSCHEGIVPAKAKSVHKVAADGECQKCHDPHASDNPANLLARGNDLCFACHKDIGETVTKAKFKHSPVQQGCLGCHAPHGSDQSEALLKKPAPALCLTCHKPDTPSFRARHGNYPVATGSCSSCHDPHGSNQPALLQNNVHAPVAAGTCNRCHEAPDSAAPFATKRPGFELCKGCHNDMVNATMSKRHLHWPVADKRGCVNCHNPHASKQPKLLTAAAPSLCGRCHSDTLKRVAGVAAKHAPVEGGTCTACHSPHGADGVHLVDQPSIEKLCSNCHDYQQHSAHPIGEKAIDPRNKNLRVDCLSCHKGHGTPFKRMLLAETNVELCTRCHKKYGK